MLKFAVDHACFQGGVANTIIDGKVEKKKERTASALRSKNKVTVYPKQAQLILSLCEVLCNVFCTVRNHAGLNDCSRAVL